MIRNIATKSELKPRVAIAGVFILAAMSAYAQTAPPPAPDAQPAAPTGATAEAERVIVTGSNIPTAEEVGPNPVLNINRDLINKRGERSVEELIRNLPVANANGVPLSNNATGFTPGAASISLRGFDPSATLTLIDGKRATPYPLGQGGTSSFVDLFSIPRAAIESIEILKDGASSTYGADAVAGVVNIKLRKNYRGAEVTMEYGNTLDKDSSEYAFDLLFGIGNENTQVTGVMNYYHRNSTFNRDRGGLSSKPPFLSTNSSPQNLQLSRDVVIGAINADATATPAERAAAIAGLPAGGVFFGHAPFLTNGFSGAADYVYSAGRTSLFNFNAFSSSLPESERWGGYVSAEHKICGDQLVLYADMLYQNVKTHNELAPAASGNFQTAGQITVAIPPNTPFPLDPVTGAPISPPGTPTSAETGVPAGAFNPFNPFQQIISGGSRLRTAEFGNRIFDDETDAILFTTGVKGDKLFDGNWGYDASFRYSQVKAVSSAQVVSASRYNRVLNQADSIFGPGGVLEGAVAYNPFGDFRVQIPSNAAVVDFASVRTNDLRVSKLAALDATIYSTELFKLPAGGVGFAAGGQFRRENIEQIPDQQNIDGDTIGGGPTAITHGGRKVYAFYAETSVPIVSPEMGIPVFHSLEFTQAARFEEFRNNDTNVLVPKFGMRWQPIDGSLTIRTTWGKGFREPSLFELFSSPTSALQPTTDPLTGNFESETPTFFSSNPNLQPEDSHAFSAGIVYTPKFVSGLTLSIDIWSIERTGIVVTPGPDQVLAREAAGTLLPGEFVERDAAGNISRVGFQFQNAGQNRARGVDLGIQYQYQSHFGTFTWLTQATYLDSFRFQPTDGDPTLEVSGTADDQFTGLGVGPIISTADDGYLKWKGRSSLDWKWNNLGIFATVNYLGGYHELLFTNPALPDKKKEHWIKHTWTFDLQGTYDFAFAPPVESQPVAGYSKDAKEMVRGKDGKAVETGQTVNYAMPCWKNLLNNTTITVGCNNVFGQDPPTAFGGFGNSTGYPGFIYDAVGRFVYVSLTKKF